MKAATRHIAQRLSFVPNAGRYSGALTGKNNPAESIIVVFKPKTSGEKAKPTMVLSELARRMPKPTTVFPFCLQGDMSIINLLNNWCYDYKKQTF